MPVPNPVGPIHYSEPRAVKVREPENTRDVHSAVHGSVAIYVDTKSEAEAILSAWRVIMQKAADEAQSILSAMRNVQPMET